MSSGMNVIKRTYPQIIQHNFQHFLKSFFSPPLSIEKRSNFDNIFRKKIDGKSYNTYLKTTRKTFFYSWPQYLPIYNWQTYNIAFRVYHTYKLYVHNKHSCNTSYICMCCIAIIKIRNMSLLCVYVYYLFIVCTWYDK